MKPLLTAYDRARDLDHNPFRAPSDFNGILRQIAGLYENASLADSDQAFRAASSPFAPGFELFLDYVHPTKQGNLLVAQTVYDEIVKTPPHRRQGFRWKKHAHERAEYVAGEFL